MVAAAENMAGHEDQALDFVRQVRPKVYLNRLIVRLTDDLLEAGPKHAGHEDKGGPASAVVGVAFSVLKLDIGRAGIDTPVTGVGDANTETPNVPVDLESGFEPPYDPPAEA
ncbi:hypothetical protein ACJ41P_31900 [Azospirillum argentinense]|uniref:Uncharacterized protein n=1 Tax=Azospirillum argentinense TaxID=2970906 RepID=A0ABW8VKR7_9PROT